MSEITQPKSGRLKKIASAADLLLLTVQDYSNLVQAVNSKVNLTGSAMTGYLTLNANPTNALHAAPKQYVDSISSSGVGAHAAFTESVHGSTSANLANRLMQRDANGRVSITGPTQPDHAITMAYFQDNVGNGLDVHAALSTAHGATSTATPSRMMVRDSSGRVSVAAPAQPDHAAQLANVTAALTALYEHMEDANEPHPNAIAITPDANKIVSRNAAGRSQVANPAGGADIANYQWVVGLLGSYAAINPASPKNGDILHSGATVYMRSASVWRQVWPAQYT